MMTPAEAAAAEGLSLQPGSRPRSPDVCHQLAEDASEGNLSGGEQGREHPAP